MNVCIIGSGYVGLVAGACFAERGNHVVCVDKNDKKISNLNDLVLPIYEPGLKELISRNISDGRLHFITDIKDAIEKSHLIFIAVGTPQDEDGSADLQHVLSVAKDIGSYIQDNSIVINKSTVPVGTTDKVFSVIKQELSKRQRSIKFDVASNPEFLKEGNAVNDFMRPDRIIIGTNDPETEKTLYNLYLPFVRDSQSILTMRPRDAEMSKYAANSMLATKISFMNEIANLCDLLGVDVENVRKGIGSDKRIGFSFIYPGCGYGGSCFPKDIKALISISNDNSYEAHVLKAVEKRNNLQKTLLANKIITHFGGNLNGLTFAVWGLSFKPETDDMREAPSLYIISELVNHGAKIIAYDPIAKDLASESFSRILPGTKQITMVNDQYEAITGVDALVLITEWKYFNSPDFDLLASSMKNKIIFDGRNQYNPDQLNRAGFTYITIGRNHLSL